MTKTSTNVSKLCYFSINSKKKYNVNDISVAARCRGGYSDYSCNVNNEGYVKHKDGSVVRNSGGYCETPHVCKNCNKGYYPTTSSGGYCRGILNKAV